MPEGSRSLPLRLAIVVGAPLALSAAAIATTHALEPGDPRTSGSPVAAGRAERPAPNVLRIGGTGSALPLVRALADAFHARSPGVQIEVPRSIGTGGGVRATADGALDLGLASRPLKPEESARGVVAIRFAATPVILAANPSVPDRTITLGRMRALILGRPVVWSNGHAAVFLQRERGDSSILVLERTLPGLADATQKAREQGLWRVLHHDKDMEEALLETTDAVGFHDLGAIRLQHLPLRPVFLEGQDPTSPAYPHLKELSFLTKGHARGLAARFIEFATSEEARRIAKAAGYRP